MTKSKKEITILDCTLRDGGYYNDWDFEYDQAKRLIAALNSAGVDIVEVGYKSLKKDKFYGLFRYCNEDYLDYLSQYSASEYAFMIDAKEFLTETGIDKTALDSIIKPAKESPFTWVRIASHFNTLKQCPGLIDYFDQQGYRVGFNLMGGSLLSEEQFVQAMELIDKTQAAVFYAADSFGSFYPEDVKQLIRLMKKHFSRKLGIHTHDNQGMAYANTLAAIEEGVDFVDATVTGMGRGAGNLATEQLLLGYGHRTGQDLNSNSLLGVIHDYIQPLKNQHQWGYSYMYMLSGLENIHPTYCQNLNEGNKLSVSQVSSIISKIPTDNRTAYNSGVLKDVMRSTLGKSEVKKGKTLAGYEVHDWSDRNVLIVAPGSSAKQHLRGLQTFIKQHDMVLVECNDTKLFTEQTDKTSVLFNRMRLTGYLRNHTKLQHTIVTGEKSMEEHLYSEHVLHLDYTINGIGIKDDMLHLSDYEAGQFAILLAVRNGAKNIYLAGFDGYEDTQRNEPMDKFFREISDLSLFENVSVASLTPSRYAHLRVESLYAIERR